MLKEAQRKRKESLQKQKEVCRVTWVPWETEGRSAEGGVSS